MRSYPLGVATAAAIVAIAGCSSGGEGGPTSTQPTSTTTATSSETHTPAPGAVEVSPGGVTTAVGADAESTEDEYSQACQAAKAWIDQQGGDRKSQIEPLFEDAADARRPARSSHLQHPVGAAIPGPAGGRHRRGPGGRRLPLLTIRITAARKSAMSGRRSIPGRARPPCPAHRRPGRWRARCRRPRARRAGRPARGCVQRQG